MELNIALAGNPNVGKTSLYNRITHSLEHVGNWHGVTVKEVSKKVMFDHHNINMTDLPGFYSMTVYSFEESVSRDAVLNAKNDLVINVCEVNNLSRNLYLTLQLLELDVPMLLVVNMMDELKKQGKVLNYRKIESVLKIPIVPMSAKYHSDVHLLMEVALDTVKAQKKNTVNLPYLKKLPIADVEGIISANVARSGLKQRYACIKVLEKDKFVLDRLQLNEKQIAALNSLGDWQSRVAQLRYEFIDFIMEGSISRSVSVEHGEMHEHIVHKVPIEIQNDQLLSLDPVVEKHVKKHNKRKEEEKLYMHGYSKIDKFVLNKYLALPIFLLVMALIFVVTFGLVGKLFTDLLELFIDKCVYAPVTGGLNAINTPDWIVALLGDGIINGVGGILVFLPQIVLLFFFLALLEDSGYISRVAFMTDGLFRKIGLSGRSAFTMLMGFGCSATAVLTARGLEDDMMRKKTVLLTPFMSCSARLPVYATIAGAFFTGGQPFIIFGLYLLGAAVALLLAAIFEKVIKPMKSGKLSFIMEMPPYRLPTFERVWQIIWNNSKVFVIRVGTVVFALNVIVWVLSNFSFTVGYTAGGGGSIMETIGGFVAPVFAPLGFGNSIAVTSLLSGLVAKEVVISSIESLGGVSAIFIGHYASLAALSFLVFTLLYVPCIATLSAIKKEIGLKWMIFSLCLQVGVAYIVSLAFYWIGRLFYLNLGVAVGILIVMVVASIVFAVIMHAVKTKGKCLSSCAFCDKKDCEKRSK